MADKGCDVAVYTPGWSSDSVSAEWCSRQVQRHWAHLAHQPWCSFSRGILTYTLSLSLSLSLSFRLCIPQVRGQPHGLKVKGRHLYTATYLRVLPDTNCYSFTYPGGMEGWVGLRFFFSSHLDPPPILYVLCRTQQTTLQWNFSNIASNYVVLCLFMCFISYHLPLCHFRLVWSATS